MKNRFLTSLFTALFAGASGGVVAQTAVLEEVTVTAQRRQESLQEVPINISVLEGSFIEDIKAFTWDNIDMPGIQIGTSSLPSALYIRGVGTSSSDSGTEQSVQVYIDGVSLGQGRMTRMGLFDMQQIEILKGPQPTYFGKNAIAGALSYITRRPTDEFESYVDLTYETEAEELVATGAVSGPLTDNVNGRIAVKYRDMDGYLQNTANGRADAGAEDIMMRTSLEWTPTDTIDVFGKFEYARDKTFGGNGQLYTCNPDFPPILVEDCTFDTRRGTIVDLSAFVDPAIESFVSVPGVDEELWDFEVMGGQVDVSAEIGNVTLESTTAYFDYDILFFSNPTYTTQQYLISRRHEDFDQFSQELRLVSAADQRLRWVVGAYYDTGNVNDGSNVVVAGRSLGFTTEAQQENSSSSIFGEVHFDMTDTLALRLGGRYSEVKKDIDKQDLVLTGFPSMANLSPVGVPLFGGRFESIILSDSRKDSDFNPSVTLDWRPTDTYMFYASYKESFKAGGLNHLRQGGGSLPFEPEFVESYEIGAKLNFQNAYVNISGFTSDYTDLQVSSRVGSFSFTTLNAAEASSNGVEVDGVWAVTNALTLRGTVNVLDTTYDSYTVAPCYNGQRQAAPNDCVVDMFGNTSQDRSGQSLPFVQDWSASAGAEYYTPLEASWFGRPIALTVAADVYHTDDINLTFDGDPGDVFPAYTKIGARIGIAAQDGTWELAFIGRNLTDELTPLFIGDAAGVPNPPTLTEPSARNAPTNRGRETAISFRYNF